MKKNLFYKQNFFKTSVSYFGWKIKNFHKKSYKIFSNFKFFFFFPQLLDDFGINHIISYVL